jgi:glycine/D-amino acid oxidase-like deaminating enzyme/nitrite reductase/ring-hydroxylating ferredoxin subunit
MKSDSGNTVSIWMGTADVPDFPPLAENLEADACIVGAGIAGLTTAYLLAVEGRKVVVLDDGPIGGGESGRTTGHFVNALDDFYTEIEKVHGPEGARLAAESHTAAINRVEAIVRSEGIACHWRRVNGYYFLGGDSTVKELDDEEQAAHRAGLTEWRRVPRAPLAAFDTGPALEAPNQGQLHILEYLSGLATAITQRGGRIFCGTHVSGFEKEPRHKVTTDAGNTVHAKSVVFCTNSPVNDWVTMHTKQAPYRTYVIAARVPAGAVEPGLYWDTPDPYHYIRLAYADGVGQDGKDWLIVGGEDHKTGQQNEDPDERLRCLEEWTRERFRMVERIDYRWSGQVLEPVDFMGFMGRNPGDREVYIITGDSGNGMTHTTVGAMLVADLVMGRENSWAKLYDPARISLQRQSAMEFVKENLNVAGEYVKYATPGQVTSPDEIPAGEGRVMRDGARKLAVYKDDRGALHVKSALCTHLYCIVNWNPLEKSWDCPCHGSRFDPYGKVLNGPAIAPLKDPE